MKIREIMEGKKEWRAHKARIEALPKDYQVVYKEIQRYLFKVGPVELVDGLGLLSGIVDLFEEGVASQKSVLEVTGRDVARFCDELLKGSKTYADMYLESVNQTMKKSIDKAMKKTK
jgi:DNA-binding ferritin-like protein (Dps family)